MYKLAIIFSPCGFTIYNTILICFPQNSRKQGKLILPTPLDCIYRLHLHRSRMACFSSNINSSSPIALHKIPCKYAISDSERIGSTCPVKACVRNLDEMHWINDSELSQCMHSESLHFSLVKKDRQDWLVGRLVIIDGW
jgi:hypothetical protein